MCDDKSLTLQIEMLSDWHIGVGMGRSGGTDSLVRKDEYGFPYIPGKTCNGILRDSCETVAESLGGNWPTYVDILFGSQPAPNKASGILDMPTPAALKINSAYYSDKIRVLLKNKPLLTSQLTFIKPGVSIDPKTGMAKADFLRFEEMARKGAKLIALVSLDLCEYNDKTQKNALALLHSGCKWTERIGGKRRRGPGKCKFNLIPEYNNWLKCLEENNICEPTRCNSVINKSDQNTAEIHTYKLIIRTLSPVCIMSKTTGNIVETLDFIPGAYILPILSSKLGAGFVSTKLKENSLSITNANPSTEKNRTLPSPLCLFQEKNDAEKIHNRAEEIEDLSCQLKQIRDKYVLLENGNMQYADIDLSLVTHNVVVDRTQRPEDNGVYTMQSIAPNTEFIAFLSIRKDDLDNKHWDDVRIGSAKHAEYGLCSIRIESYDEISDIRICEGDTLKVWLVSDVLLRDSKLRLTPTVTALKYAMETRLNASAAAPSTESVSEPTSPDDRTNKVTLTVIDDDQYVKSSARQRRLDSWQTSWGLPRPSLVGLKAGTYVEFNVMGTINTDILREIQLNGIGERTAEGYGRVLFNPEIKKDITIKKKESQSDDSIVDLDEQNKTIVETIQVSALKNLISDAAISFAADLNKRRECLAINEKSPNNSQLEAMRMWTMRLADDGKNYDSWSQQLCSWLISIGKRNKHKVLWPENSIRKTALLNGLNTDFINSGITANINQPVLTTYITNNREVIWECLEDSIPWDSILITFSKEEEKTGLKEKLWYYAVKSLIDAIVRSEIRERAKGESDAKEA